MRLTLQYLYIYEPQTVFDTSLFVRVLKWKYSLRLIAFIFNQHVAINQLMFIYNLGY